MWLASWGAGTRLVSVTTDIVAAALGMAV
jgi:hypothetical protein